LAEKIAEYKPNIVIGLGTAAARKEFRIERVAINLDDFFAPDCTGNMPIDEPIYDEAPGAYFTSLPVKHLVSALRSHQQPVILSHASGTFLCNHIYYGLLHVIATKKLDIFAGFVHIPRLLELSPTADPRCMSRNDVIDVIKIIIETSILHRGSDIRINVQATAGVP
jgi:pyroglutamyl-peptidase